MSHREMYVVVISDEKNRQRAYGPMSEDDAFELRNKLWDRADEAGEVLHVEIIRHAVDTEELSR